MDDPLNELSHGYLSVSMEGLLRKSVDDFLVEFLEKFQENPQDEILKVIQNKIIKRCMEVVLKKKLS